MRILFCAPQHVGFWGPAGGVLKLMGLHRHALEIRGHRVYTPQTYQCPPWDDLDIAHLFMANGDTYNLGILLRRHLPLVVSPILDQDQGNWLLRINVLFDRATPGMFTHLGRAAALCQQADRLCLMSEFESQRVRKGLGVGTAGDVIRPSCPVPPPTDERLPRPRERPYILFMGDAGNPRKNVLRLIEAAQGVDADLWIAGPVSPGATGRQVERRSRDNPRVRLLGYQDDDQKRRLMENAAVFVLPSKTEGIGFAALEAAALGATVVVTRHGGAPEYLGDTAYYTDPTSVADLRRCLVRALERPLDARSDLTSRYEAADCGAVLEDCYERARESSARGRSRLG